MEKWSISKEIEFDFGHRVWTQVLNPYYALNTQCVCKRIHGHRGKVIVHLTTKDINLVYQSGMVTDFKHLGFLKNFIDNFIDHRFLIDINDPWIDNSIMINSNDILIKGIYINGQFKELNEEIKSIKSLHKYFPENKLGIINLYHDNQNTTDEISEKINWNESLVFCNFVPTAENISKFIYQYASDKFKNSYIEVEKIEFYETPKSKAIYVMNI